VGRLVLAADLFLEKGGFLRGLYFALKANGQHVSFWTNNKNTLNKMKFDSGVLMSSFGVEKDGIITSLRSKS